MCVNEDEASRMLSHDNNWKSAKNNRQVLHKTLSAIVCKEQLEEDNLLTVDDTL